MEKTQRFNKNYNTSFTDDFKDSRNNFFHGWSIYANYIPVNFDVSLKDVILLLNKSKLITFNQIWAGIIRYNENVDFGDDLNVIKSQQKINLPHVVFINHFTDQESLNFINMRIGYNYTQKSLEEEKNIERELKYKKEKNKLQELKNMKNVLLNDKTNLLQKLILSYKLSKIKNKSQL